MELYKSRKIEEIRSKDKFSIKKNEKTEMYTLVFPKSEAVALADNLMSNTRIVSGSPFQELTVPSTIKTIGNRCFTNCVNIENVNMANSVTSIGKSCFKGCKKLKKVKLSDNISVLPEYLFNSCDSLENVNIPNGVHTIKEGCFCLCRNLKHVNTPSALTVIGPATFFGCKSLEGFNFNEGTVCVSNDLFVDCEKLEHIELPKSLKKIGDKAFLRCIQLQDIELPENLRVIGNNAFEDCTSLKSIVIPASVSRIGAGAFENCIGLEEVTILPSKDPKKKIQIQEEAFSGCSGIRTLNLPKGVFPESSFDFNYMPNLKKLVYDGKALLNLVDNEKFNNLVYNGRYIYVEYLNRNGEIISRVFDCLAEPNIFNRMSAQLTSQFRRLSTHNVFKNAFDSDDTKYRICLNMLGCISYGTSKRLLDLLLERKLSNNFGAKKKDNEINLVNKNLPTSINKREHKNLFSKTVHRIKDSFTQINPFRKKNFVDSVPNMESEQDEIVTLTDFFETLFGNINMDTNIMNYTKFFYQNLFEISNIHSMRELETLSMVQRGFDNILLKSLKYKIKFDNKSLTLEDVLQCRDMLTRIEAESNITASQRANKQIQNRTSDDDLYYDNEHDDRT